MDTLTTKKLRTFIRQYPRMKSLLVPIYMQILHFGWLYHNHLKIPFYFKAEKWKFKIYPNGSIAKVMYIGDFEANERDFITTFLKPGMTVVDAGANIGVYSLISSALVGITGQVHAFEPGILTFNRLQNNLDLNRCKNVCATHKALSNTNEQMVLRIDQTHPTLDSHCYVESINDIINHTSTDEIVDCIKLDDYFFKQKVVIDFMKIDVEGAEMAVLQGAKKMIERSTNITILLECSSNRKEVWDLLLQQGFKCYIWDCLNRLLKPVDFNTVVLTNNVILRRF